MTASLAFLAADIKYTWDEGVKICEIQSGSSSTFEGYDFVMGEEGLFAKRLCDAFTAHTPRMWFRPSKVLDLKLKAEFLRRGYKPVKHVISLAGDEAFLAEASQQLKHPGSLSSYQGFYYASKMSSEEICQFKRAYPSILIVDEMVMPYLDDKLAMTRLFSEEELRPFKPRWGSYPKHYSDKLAEKIKREIGGDLFVIKPRRAALGRGVIITDRQGLDQVLRKILLSKRSELLSSGVLEYQHWAIDKSDCFLVEEFSRGEIIPVAHMGNRKFDTNVRVLFLLAYNDGLVQVEYISAHISIPRIAIDEKGTLTERHKSYTEPPFFLAVPDEMLEEVIKGLDRMLPLLYRKMAEASGSP
ncbi:hypothetical protein [Estrella lausannensis]|uniref:hypothetical protein n=1 Tax=Estrella lausannensis TaxID=483423 RepID=UPI001179A6B7|nr:hypothetical protein [Estrella lausannensis]